MRRGLIRAACAVASIALSLTAAAVWAGSASAAYPGAAGRIAFVRSGNIYTIEPNGRGLTRLTADGHASGPRWAPLGARIAYVDAGNLWVMNANGSHKARLTDAAPRYTDSRPTWSSNGQYLVFVKTASRAAYGYLTRYNLANGAQVTYTDTINPSKPPIAVAALPAPVAWTHPSTGGYFIAYEGAAAQCASPYKYCLNLLGLSTQSEYQNGFPSSEDSHTSAVRFTDPDWYPRDTDFGLDIIATSEKCPAGHCAVTGTQYQINTPVLPGSYQAVFAPTGEYIAYVENVRGTPVIYTQRSALDRPYGPSTKLTTGTQPDWQPLPLG
jgi:WD40-like Beta Propeller Repeat